MSDRPEGYEGLPDIGKAVFELRRIGEQLDCLICLLEPDEEPELEPETDPAKESEVLEPVEVKKRSIWPFGQRGSKA
ncbi:MAG: hypothetical protein IH953_02795 [Chloroflexi bacterium]|nr:hypothetical protein [Chloroflexota bacterium]